MTLEQDTFFMQKALRQVEIGLAEGQAPFGAVVVGPDGELIAEGHNMVKADKDPTAHGEVVAIRNAWQGLGTWRMQGCTLYTSCEPCLICTHVIADVGISRVVFAARGTDVPTYQPLLGMDFAQVSAWINAQAGWSPIEVVGDFMREQSIPLIQAYTFGG